jgi:hypothetical protein
MSESWKVVSMIDRGRPPSANDDRCMHASREVIKILVPEGESTKGYYQRGYL